MESALNPVPLPTPSLHPDDVEFVRGLKEGNNLVCNRFFYGEIVGILHSIRLEVFQGLVDLDELVGELYLYLSRDGWEKLDGFGARNNCRLRSWIIPVAWRYFLSIRHKLVCDVASVDPELVRVDSGSCDDLRIQIAIDVNAVLQHMPNRRYAEIIQLLIVEGYGAQDVADMLGMKVENVYNLKHRAVLQFIELYGRR